MKQEYNGELLQKCSGCDTMIFFKLTRKGKYMPVNRETLEPHFADCPAAAKFRKQYEPREKKR